MVCMFLPCPRGLSGSYPSLKMATGKQEHSIPTVVVAWSFRLESRDSTFPRLPPRGGFGELIGSLC